MSKDTIYRQAAIDALKICQRHCIDPDDYYISAEDAEYRISAIPSAQPERKRGKWIDETFKPWGLVYHPYKCDQCGEYSEADSNYCPNCGADMRGKTDEAD